MRYITAPLDLTIEELEIYRLLYTKSNFENMSVKYTLDQLVMDSDKRLLLTKTKVSRIINNFLKSNYININKKGSKGNPTIYKINKIKDLFETQTNTTETQINITETQTKLKDIDYQGIDDNCQTQTNTTETNIGLKRNANLIPINDKDNDKDKEINKHLSEKEIFEHWNFKKGTISHQDKMFDDKKGLITTAIKKFGKNKIMTAINRLDSIVLSKNCKYEYKWSLFDFIKQGNGIPRWLDDGQLWNNYKSFVEQNSSKEREEKFRNATGNNFWDL